MSEQIKRAGEFQKRVDFKEELTAILSTPLSPDNIDSYAENALSRLISLTRDAVDHYAFQPTLKHELASEQEDAAFAYYELDGIDTLLDYLSDKAKEINSLDSIIAAATKTSQIITPPSEAAPTVVPGNGNFIRRGLRPKLKTLLFVASNSLGVNPEPQAGELKITEGALSNDMMRNAPYYLVELPTINRSVLICDELGNITYVFNNERMEEYAIHPQDLGPMTKSDIDDLLLYDPTLGKRIRYYPATYVPTLEHHLLNEWPATDQEEPAQEEVGRYLYPTAPEGYEVKDTISKNFGVEESAVKRAIQELGIEPHIYRHGRGMLLPFYSPEDIGMIRIFLEEQGTFLDGPPEGYRNLDELAMLWSEVSGYSISRAIRELSLPKEESVYKRKGHPPTRFYSPEEIDQIYKSLEEKGLFKPFPPEGYMVLTDATRFLGLANGRTLQRAANALGISGTNEYRAQNGEAVYYAPDDIEKIRLYLESNGLFADPAPEGHLNLPEVAKKLGVGIKIVSKITRDLGIETDTFRGKSKRPEAFFSPDNIEKIRTYLEEQGKLVDFAPPGYMHKDAIWRCLEVPETVVKKYLIELGIEGRYFRSPTLNKPLRYYSPEEIERVRERVAATRFATSMGHQALDGSSLATDERPRGP